MAASWQQWYKHDINAWQGSANVQALSDAAYRAFHHLLQAQFQSEDGMLPGDDRQLAKLSRKLDAWQSIREEVLELFKPGPDGRIYNQKQYQSWCEARELSSKKGKGGRTSAEKRWGNNTEPAEQNHPDKTLIAQQQESCRTPSGTAIHGTLRYVTERKEKYSPPAREAEASVPEDPYPEGLPLMAMAAQLMLRTATPSDHGTRDMASQAISALAKVEDVPPHTAAWRLEERIRAAQEAGDTVNRFWLSDSKWRKNTGEKAHAKSSDRNAISPARQRVNGTIRGIRAYAEGRGWEQPDAAAGADSGGMSEPGPGRGDADVHAPIRVVGR